MNNQTTEPILVVDFGVEDVPLRNEHYLRAITNLQLIKHMYQGAHFFDLADVRVGNGQLRPDFQLGVAHEVSTELGTEAFRTRLGLEHCVPPRDMFEVVDGASGT